MRGCFLGLVAVLLVTVPAVAAAQTEPEKELAQKRYKVGEQLYDIGQYEKALVEFEEAYRLYPLPAMLYNIARSHEVLGNLDKAISNYKLFLEKLPDSPHSPTVKGRVKSLEARLARRKKAEQDKAAAAKETPKPLPPAKPEVKEEKPAPVVAPVVEPATNDTERTWRWTAGLTGIGVGGAALVTGIAFGALAAGKSSDYEDLRDSEGLHDDLKKLRDTGEQYETIGTALMIGGGVIAAAGGALLIWELMGSEEDTASANAMFTPVVTRDGAGISAHLTF